MQSLSVHQRGRNAENIQGNVLQSGKEDGEWERWEGSYLCVIVRA